MRIEEKRIKLKNGQLCILRSPKLQDAEQLVEYLKVTAAETDFLLKYPEEVKISVEQEKEILKWFIDSKRDLMIIAEVDGEIVGNCSFSAVGGKYRVKHRCSLGIALYQQYWGLGIGQELISLLLEEARKGGYEQIELEVVSRNTRAIALYDKLGFVRIGERPYAMKHKDGTYDSNVIMIKQLRYKYAFEYGNSEDIVSWMELVNNVSWNFPGLETSDKIEEHKNTVLRFMGRKEALCVKEDEKIVGVLLFSTKHNMICCLAVLPSHRRKGIASMLLVEALNKLDRDRPIKVSTFREGDSKGVAPRALYKKFGFVEGKLIEEFGYPNQEFVLFP